ncbi:DUF2721 domain-containing protein [Aquimarina sp. AD1]|uniref:DUF2721 domain-containing protein n=1 Tax=Aquimarina sp. (strain AD1) TaxID=1714848 RepID=UPI000E4A7964|nr:DUF2721 domain-containing protein [Aquimarina sp. AD1]AXT56613.1 DUF2721 domain-containing protein [Aquimarina sp. AD1]RKN13663.1 DUF2721 domain-containing protein [Aquimarina sp. AD1]
MEHWYLPATIIPGIGLLILSTSNLLVNLSTEIKTLITEDIIKEQLIERKLRQLKLLNSAMVFLYIAVASFVISALVSGIYKSIDTDFNATIYITIAGITSALLGLIALIIYSFRAVKIRQDQYHNKF